MSCSELATKLSAAGGSALVPLQAYWSATEFDDENAWVLGLVNAVDIMFYNETKTVSDFLVRACLAF
jgi:hypothetical protein